MSYQDVEDRLYRGHRKIANNTYLTLELLGTVPDAGGYHIDEHIDMRLHGNLVARFKPEYIELSSAGWRTTTTRARLNLALDLAGIRGRVSQRKWRWYLDTNLISMMEFYDGVKVTYGGDVIH